MAYRRVTLAETECPECHAQVTACLEGDVHLYDFHYRRNPFTKNIEQCPHSKALVTTRIREYDMIVTGI